jgi:hypothetical protein
VVSWAYSSMLRVTVLRDHRPSGAEESREWNAGVGLLRRSESEDYRGAVSFNAPYQTRSALRPFQYTEKFSAGEAF